MTDNSETNGINFSRRYNLSEARRVPSHKQLAAHQQAALVRLEAWYQSSPTDPHGTILVLPTGGGKTMTAVRFTCCHPLSDGFKVLWLAHTHHLLEQALTTFAKMIGIIAEPKSDLAIRVVSGATDHCPVHSINNSDDVVIASLQAVAKAIAADHQALNEFLQSANGKLLVVFDEAHHSPAPSYRSLLQKLREKCHGMMLLGLTATPTYSDEKKKGWLAKLFPQGIIYQETPQNLLAAGVLAQPNFEQARTNFEPDFTDRDYANWIGTNRDIPEELITFLATNRSRNEYVAGYYVQHRARFGKTIMFADRSAQCEVICQLLKDRGVRAGAVYSQVAMTFGTPEDRNRRPATENARILQQFRNDELDVLVNVKMLTEGTDVPDVQTVFLTRQTTSQIQMMQMIGRALRGPKFGGTDTANIVLFVDDWKQSIRWAAWEQFASGMADESAPEFGKRPPLQLISIDLIRRLAKQMDSGSNVNAAPFHSFLPIGWYRAEFDAQIGKPDEIESVRQLVMVFQNDKPNFENFIAAMKTEDLGGFEETDVQLTDVRPQLELWEGRYFSEASQRIGLSLVNDMFLIASHMAKNDREAPRFFAFEDRQKHDLDAIAKQVIADDLSVLAIDKLLRGEFTRQDRFWKSIYPRYDQFKYSCDACINYVVNLRQRSEKPADYVAPFVSEKLSDREPSNELKEQVKSRDHYRCLCCGAKKPLQIDHIHSSYLGGRNEIDNLQTLCSNCNSEKGATLKIDFRNNQSLLTISPNQLPQLMFPTERSARDPEKWERFLCRWINFFFQCAAVDTVDVGEEEEPHNWSIHLYPGNNAAWLLPHLDALVSQIRETSLAVGFQGIPQRIIVNRAGQTAENEVPQKSATHMTTLEAVLQTIEKVEGFQVHVSYRDGKKVRGDFTRDIEPYPYQKALNGEKTVEAWKYARFLNHYGMFHSWEFVVQIFNGNGYACAGQTKLRNVRAS